MTAHITLSLGRDPWQPSSNVRMIEELGHWDMPTEGILKQRFRNRYFLFRCLAGASGKYNLWAYVPLTRAEVRKLKVLLGQDLNSYATELMAARTFMMALAEEGRGIVHGQEGRLDTASGKPQIAETAVKAAEAEYEQEAGAMRHLLATC
jgi:hypothetical protein